VEKGQVSLVTLGIYCSLYKTEGNRRFIFTGTSLVLPIAVALTPCNSFKPVTSAAHPIFEASVQLLNKKEQRLKVKYGSFMTCVLLYILNLGKATYLGLIRLKKRHCFSFKAEKFSGD